MKYYEAVSDDVFEEIKRECIGEWKTHDNTYGYVDEKVGRIENLENIKDNGMYMLAMFDHIGQAHVKKNLSDKALKEISERLK